MMLLSFITFLILSWAGHFMWRERKWIAMCIKLHREPWNWPGFGCCTVLAKGGEGRMEVFQRYGKVSMKHDGFTSLWLGSKLFVVVTDANITVTLLKTFLAKDDVMNIVHEFLGNGSIFAPVQIWRPRRKVIAPTFSIKNLNRFVEVFYRQSSIMVEQLKDAAGKGTFSVWKFLTTYTMDSVCETALGVEVNAQQQPDHPFLTAFDTHCQMGAGRLILPPSAQQAYKYLPIYKTYMKPIYLMWNFVDNIITDKRKELAERNENILRCNNNETKESLQNQQKTFLELFIESSGGSSGFTDIELREETLVLLLAGTDTSAVGSAFTSMMLARHPDVQEKLYEEIKEVLGNTGTPITPKDLLNLKYLEAVIKESLRLYPPVPIIVRKAEKDFELPSGITIVKSTALLFNIWAIHRNPLYWGEDAEQFKPDRFVGSTLMHPAAAFMPFSNGPRSCLGYQYAMMSMKTAVANLVRHYRIHPAYPVQDNNAPLRVKFDVMMKHVDNFELQLEERT